MKHVDKCSLCRFHFSSHQNVLPLLFFDFLLNMKSSLWIVFRCPTGQITLSEFMEGAQKDEWVMNLLKLDVNATGWVIQNCGKLPWPLTLVGSAPTGFCWGWHRGAVFKARPASPCWASCDVELELSDLFHDCSSAVILPAGSKGPCCTPVVVIWSWVIC